MPFINALKALYAYAGTEEDELTFEEDEILCVLDDAEAVELFGEEASTANRDPEWVYARPVLKQELCGLVPLNYVEPVESLGRLRAEYAYEAQEENELAFGEEEELELLSRLDEDSWWLVRNAGGMVGLVPSNYLQLLIAEEGEAVEDEQQIIEETDDNVKSEEYEQNQSSPLTEHTNDNNSQEEPPPPPSQSLAWIDTVTVVKEWPSSQLSIDEKEPPRKGTLLITKDHLLAFVDDNDRSQVLFWTPLGDVISYDPDYQVLTVRCEMDEQRLTLRVGRRDGEAGELIKAIHASGPLSPVPVNLVDGMVIHATTAPSLPPPPVAISPLADDASSSVKSPRSVTSPTLSLGSGPMVKALYAYFPQAEDELQVKAGERLILIDEKSSSDWWLVQRLYGSRRRGLVPSSYLVSAEEDEAELGSKTSSKMVSPKLSAEQQDKEAVDGQPKSPSSRPNTPRLAFLEELRERAMKSPVAIAITQMEEAEAAEKARIEAARKEAEKITRREVERVQMEREQQEEEQRKAKEEAEKIQEPEDESTKAAKKTINSIPIPPPMPPVQVERETTAKPQQSSINIPNAALAAVMLKKKQDIDAGKISMPGPVLPKKTINAGVKASPQSSATLSSAPKKTNPWSSIVLNKTSIQRRNSVGKAAARTLPSRPEKAQSQDKPKPSNTRLWKDRTGAFQVEAEYLGLKQRNPFHVELHKLNGQRITVPLDRLSERDIDFVRRREGIPEEMTAKISASSATGQEKAFNYDGIDWILFFVHLANLDTSTAKRYARRMVQERVGETGLPKINRDWIIKNLFDDPGSESGHLEAILAALNRQKQFLADREATRRNLEAIRLYSSKPTKQPETTPLKTSSISSLTSSSLAASATTTPIFSDLGWSGSAASSRIPSQGSIEPQSRKSIRDFPVLSPTSPRGSIVTRVASGGFDTMAPTVQTGMGLGMVPAHRQSTGTILKPSPPLHNTPFTLMQPINTVGPMMVPPRPTLANSSQQAAMQYPQQNPQQPLSLNQAPSMQYPQPNPQQPPSLNQAPSMQYPQPMHLPFGSISGPSLSFIPQPPVMQVPSHLQRHSEPLIRPPPTMFMPPPPQIINQTFANPLPGHYPTTFTNSVLYPGTATTTTVQRHHQFVSSSGSSIPGKQPTPFIQPQQLPQMMPPPMMLASEWPSTAIPSQTNNTVVKSPEQAPAESTDRYAILRQVDPHGPSFIQ